MSRGKGTIGTFKERNLGGGRKGKAGKGISRGVMLRWGRGAYQPVSMLRKEMGKGIGFGGAC